MSFRVTLVLPPDPYAPEIQRHHRFPPLGPAIVAAVAAEAGVSVRAVDLEQSVYAAPLRASARVLDDVAAVDRALAGHPSPDLDALVDELLARIGASGEAPDAYAFSLDRHTQAAIALAMGRELKRRTGRPVVFGGAGARGAMARALRTGLRGVDVITDAAEPSAIRRVFARLRELPRGRDEAPADPDARTELVAAIGRGPRPEDEPWPMPDFSIYDLDAYRRDAIAAEGARFPGSDILTGRG